MSIAIEELVLWNDESLVAINKPPGLLTLPDGYDPNKKHLKEILEPLFGKLWTVHRLDKETSGVIIFARNADAHRSLNNQFQNRTVKKAYHALVHGNPEWHEQVVDLPLRTNVGKHHRTVIDLSDGKQAVTRLRCLWSQNNSSLIEASPETGRSHQIRAHLYAAGYPILSDRLYGEQDPADLAIIERLALHAVQITFTHPLVATKKTIEAPYFNDFDLAIRIIKKMQ